MAENEEQKARRLKEWRQKRAAKRARTGDTPEKQAEKRPADPSVMENMNRAGASGFIGGN